MLNCSIFLTLGQLCVFCKNTELSIFVFCLWNGENLLKEMSLQLPPPWWKWKHRRWKERNPCCLSRSRFSPPHLGLGYLSHPVRPPLPGVRLIYLHQWPQGLCQGSWGHCGSTTHTAIDKGMKKEIKALKSCLGWTQGDRQEWLMGERANWPPLALLPPSHSTFHANNTQPWGECCAGEKSTVIIY